MFKSLTSVSSSLIAILVIKHVVFSASRTRVFREVGIKEGVFQSRHVYYHSKSIDFE
jgi:hypothetical protein